MINTIITKTQNSKKAIDFRDGLVLANENDYAMLHGAGGKKYAAVSVIPCFICDYSKGKGDKAVTVNANFDLELIALLHAKAQQILMNSAVTTSGNNEVASESCSVRLSKNSWSEIVKCLQMVINASKTQSAIAGNDLIELGKSLRAIHTDGKQNIDAQRQAKEQKETASSDPNQMGYASDFKHTQVKVNGYKMGQNGLPKNRAPVTKVTITHNPKDKLGNVNRSPWYISISNGNAEIRVDDNGATSSVGGTFQETGKASVNVSDIDMFRMMEDCKRYIDAFTMCFGLPLVQQGVARRLQALEERRMQKQNNRM